MSLDSLVAGIFFNVALYVSCRMPPTFRTTRFSASMFIKFISVNDLSSQNVDHMILVFVFFNLANKLAYKKQQMRKDEPSRAGNQIVGANSYPCRLMCFRARFNLLWPWCCKMWTFKNISYTNGLSTGLEHCEFFYFVFVPSQITWYFWTSIKYAPIFILHFKICFSFEFPFYKNCFAKRLDGLPV